MSENFYRNKFVLGTIPQMSGVSRNRGRDVKSGGVYVYTNLDFKGFTTDDRLSNGWTTVSGNNNNATVSGGLWYANNTDGANAIYKNFPSGLSNFKIVHKTASCSSSDAGWGANSQFVISDTQHTGANTFDPPNILAINREMYASAAQSYNGIATYHRGALTRKISGTRTRSGTALRDAEGATVWNATFRMELEFDNGTYTLSFYSNDVLVSSYNFTANFTKAYTIYYTVGSSTGGHPQVDEISLYY